MTAKITLGFLTSYFSHTKELNSASRIKYELWYKANACSFSQCEKDIADSHIKIKYRFRS